MGSGGAQTHEESVKRGWTRMLAARIMTVITPAYSEPGNIQPKLRLVWPFGITQSMKDIIRNFGRIRKTTEQSQVAVKVVLGLSLFHSVACHYCKKRVFLTRSEKESIAQIMFGSERSSPDMLVLR